MEKYKQYPKILLTIKPGDIVCWDIGGGTTHIGIVIDRRSDDNKHHLIVHNIGAGQVIQDCLFDFKIIGHYRYEKQIP